ncbi:hypothetical protein BDV10DRAFT_185151 [Aspergillus recurvatus]
MPPDIALGMCKDLYLNIHGGSVTGQGSHKQWVGDGAAANAGGNAPAVVLVSSSPVVAAKRPTVRSRPHRHTTSFPVVPALTRSSDGQDGEIGMGFYEDAAGNVDVGTGMIVANTLQGVRIGRPVHPGQSQGNVQDEQEQGDQDGQGTQNGI